MAGSSVSDTMTETRTTMMAPAPRLRKIVEGMSSMPSSATTTVMPLKNTARLAVEPVAAIASYFVEARAALLAVAGDDEQRVVDADGEAHHRDDVGDEERELENLAEQRGDADGDEDREDAENERHAGRNERPEDEDEHEQGDRYPEGLAALEVVLGLGLELVAEAGAAGDQDFDARVLPSALSTMSSTSPMLSSASCSSPAITNGRIVVWRSSDTREGSLDW